MNFTRLFEELPRLENHILYTQKITELDAEEFIEIYTNQNCFLFTPGNACKTRKAAANIIHHFERDYLQKRFFKLGMYLKQSNKLIGILEVFNINETKEEVEVGYRINQSYWNQGYATAGLNLLVKYLQDQIEVKCILSSVMMENIASNRILIKNQFMLIHQSFQEKQWKNKGLVNLNHYMLSF